MVRKYSWQREVVLSLGYVEIRATAANCLSPPLPTPRVANISAMAPRRWGLIIAGTPADCGGSRSPKTGPAKISGVPATSGGHGLTKEP